MDEARGLRAKAKQEPKLGPSEFAQAVVASLTRRLTFTFPRVGPRGSPPFAHPPLHRDFRFLSAEMNGKQITDQVLTKFSWAATPNRVDSASVDFARFLRQTEMEGPELCASFIVQELEEDLCSGETPDRPPPVWMGVSYQRGV